MLFQTLDDKKECVGIYLNGELQFGAPLPTTLTTTWGYSSFLESHDIEYVKLYCNGQTLSEVCPDHLMERWSAIEKKFKAFIKSFYTARVSLNKNCFFDLVPKKFLLEMCYVKNLICEHVLATRCKPDNYDYLLDLTKALEDVKHSPLKINKKNLTLYKTKHRQFAHKLTKLEPFCKFNIFGTKTGRLTTEKNSFPILTLDKELRCAIEPTNDYFVELDFNAAELRTLLSLQGISQPSEDIHQWNIDNVFRTSITRAEAKKKIFAWLYNPTSYDRACEKVYDRQNIVNKFYNSGIVTTHFGKSIPSDPRTALNYIIQSTCAENVLRQMVKLNNFLKDKSSFVAFPVHDSVVIDLAASERGMLSELVKIFSHTDLGVFKVNVSAGPNFGNLKLLEIK